MADKTETKVSEPSFWGGIKGLFGIDWNTALSLLDTERRKASELLARKMDQFIGKNNWLRSEAGERLFGVVSARIEAAGKSQGEPLGSILEKISDILDGASTIFWGRDGKNKKVTPVEGGAVARGRGESYSPDLQLLRELRSGQNRELALLAKIAVSDPALRKTLETWRVNLFAAGVKKSQLEEEISRAILGHMKQEWTATKQEREEAKTEVRSAMVRADAKAHQEETEKKARLATEEAEMAAFFERWENSIATWKKCRATERAETAKEREEAEARGEISNTRGILRSPWLFFWYALVGFPKTKTKKRVDYSWSAPF